MRVSSQGVVPACNIPNLSLYTEKISDKNTTLTADYLQMFLLYIHVFYKC